MRTGLIPNAHANVAEASTPLNAPLPDAGVRGIARDKAALLDAIHEASGKGNVPETLRLAARLATLRHQEQRHQFQAAADAWDPYAFDTTAA